MPRDQRHAHQGTEHRQPLDQVHQTVPAGEDQQVGEDVLRAGRIADLSRHVRRVMRDGAVLRPVGRSEHVVGHGIPRVGGRQQRRQARTRGDDDHAAQGEHLAPRPGAWFVSGPGCGATASHETRDRYDDDQQRPGPRQGPQRQHARQTQQFRHGRQRHAPRDGAAEHRAPPPPPPQPEADHQERQRDGGQDGEHGRRGPRRVVVRTVRPGFRLSE